MPYDIEPSPLLPEHSLIQKAVRRGNVDLIEKVFTYLINIDGQDKWLRDRLAVIGYEECWQYANTLNFTSTDYQLLQQYKAFACKVKNKDCDGLAYLANRLKEGDTDALRGNAKQCEGIRRVAGAMRDDITFWNWIEQQPLYSQHHQRIEAAKAAINRSKENKAIMYAAAYLSVTYPIPPVEEIQPNNNPIFQYWTAIDKHTVEGTQIISQASKKINLNPSRGRFITFYFAGALCNKVQDMPFFKLMKEYKVEAMKMTCAQAKAKWLELRPLLIEMTKLEVELMLKRINTVKKNLNEPGLFD